MRDHRGSCLGAYGLKFQVYQARVRRLVTQLKGYANDSSIVYVNDYLINAIDGSVLENPRDEMLANAYGQ